MRDIADKVNVSVSTVSRALSRDKGLAGGVRISDETIRRVQQAAVRMGYLSHGIVGLVVPWTTVFYTVMMAGIVEILRREHYSLTMGLPTAGLLEQEVEETRTMEAKGVDCLIVTPNSDFLTQLESHPGLFEDRGRVVLMNRFSRSGIPYATVDHRRCGYLATKHLLELGHRRIAFYAAQYLYVSEENRTRAHIVDARLRGHLRALKEYDLRFVSVSTPEQLFGLPEPVTAVYCSQYAGGADLLGACWDRGVRVPDDLSIVGQHDSREKQVVRPRVTTVDVREHEVGARAAQMCLDLIDGKQVENAVLEPRLIVRETTRAM